MTRRQEQVNHAIRREISDLLARHVNDPRITGIISVTRVNVSPDLMQARVFISVMGSEEEKRESFEGIGAASGFLQRELGSRLKIRRTPRLLFERDDTIERAERISELIDRALND